MKVEFTDNSPAVLDEFQAAILRALERCGLQAETFAKQSRTEEGDVDTGNLRNSIAHAVNADEKKAIVGTNSEYGAYVHQGTGKYYPGGRAGWWVYVKDNANSGSHAPREGAGKTYTFEEAKQIMAILRSKGLDAHMTEGREADPFLRNAVSDHADVWRAIVKDEMKG